ncbi:MAG: GntR family transcriptional regulator [Terracidiphilus sp.]|jgi:GntR family transcriptional regulator
MNLRINFSSGVPIYVQLMEQIKHAADTGAIREGEQLPTIRKIAEELAMNPNTVARAYRELEREGVVEVRHGSGVFVAAPQASSAKTVEIRKAGETLRHAVQKGMELGLSESELRRVFENELSKQLDKPGPARSGN